MESILVAFIMVALTPSSTEERSPESSAKSSSARWWQAKPHRSTMPVASWSSRTMASFAAACLSCSLKAQTSLSHVAMERASRAARVGVRRGAASRESMWIDGGRLRLGI